MERGGLAQPGVKFRDMIRDEIRKQMAGVDQVSMGVVSFVDDEVEVLLDGMSVPLPVIWAAGVAPVVGLRVVCLALRGGQTWIVSAEVGNVGGGSHAHSLGDLGDVELSGVTLGDVLRFGGTDWGNAALGLDDLDDVDASVLAAGDTLEYDGASWLNVAREGFRYGGAVRFTSSGTFEEGDYSGLMRVRATSVGGGGGSGGAATTAAGESSAGGGGGGGGTGIADIDAADLASSETVTVGAGGTRGSPGSATSGGQSSFGSHCTGNGGGAGSNSPAQAAPFAAGSPGVGGGGSGDLVIQGDDGAYPLPVTTINPRGGQGGGSYLSGVNRPDTSNNQNGRDATGIGQGGAGGHNGAGQSAKFGGHGAAGIVIVDLFY